MGNLTVSNILAKLSPMNDIPWGFMIYFIIVMCLIALFIQKENSPFLISVLLAGAVMAGLMEQIGVFAPNNFGAFMLRTVLLTFPTVVAGMTKTPKSRGFLIAAALMGALLLFGRWATLPH